MCRTASPGCALCPAPKSGRPRSEAAVMQRNPSTCAEDNAREWLMSVLRIAQAAGDLVHAKALRLIVKGFDERVRAGRGRAQQVSAQLAPKPAGQRERQVRRTHHA